MDEQPSVSIVTPTFNRCHSLVRLLDALAGQTYPAEKIQVVVVDDGSTDETPSSVNRRQTPFALRFVRQSHRGPAAARNLGVLHASGDILLFLDDDVVPARDLVERHVSRHHANPGVVVVGPMLPPTDWPRPVWVRWEEEKLARQYQAMLEGAYGCTPRQFYTANASLHRDQFLETGGFDPRFTRAEDVELGYRLRDRHARFVFDPRATVQHFASRSLDAWQRAPYQYGRYDVIMGRDKRYDTLSTAVRDFSSRHWLGRYLARLTAGRPRLVTSAALVLRASVLAADRIGAARCAFAALSGLFNLLYWHGVADELGGRAEFRRWLAQRIARP